MTNIYDYQYDELEIELKKLNFESFRVKQIWDWLYIKLVVSFEEMKNIKKEDKAKLSQHFYIPNYKVLKQQRANDGTRKLLLELDDKRVIETVIMKYSHGYSACVTTQIGCKIGCTFCASHIAGFERNLTAGEIVAQIIHWQRLLKENQKRVSHVVVMGIGEPFDNYNNLISFLNIINDKNGLEIGARHITVSTSGIIPGIEKFTNYDKQVNLAISLHAPNDEIRSEIMKINDVYPLKALMMSIKKYQKQTNRRVTFEYIMLKGINDQVEHAKELGRLISGINCHVNLIPYNSVDETKYETTNNQQIEKFYKVLQNSRINATIRYSKGNDIDGACGQLRHKHKRQTK